MKIKVILFSLVLSMVAGGAFAQVEQDDMYFTAKDRVKLREAKQGSDLAMASARRRARQEEDELNNPKDTYSARNVNPEYTSRSHSKTAQEDEEDYFINNYRFNKAEQYNNWNNNFNNWYGNSWYRTSYWGASINSWNSPYYGYYDSYNSPWYDPYWAQNGWSSSYSYYAGSRWNYGWGGNYNYWNRPYCPASSYYASNAYWNYYRNPTTIVVINNNESAGRGVAYGKRPTRGSAIVSERGDSRSRSTTVSPGTGGRSSDISGGRTSSTRTEYYNRSWRNNDTPTPATQDSRTRTQYNRPNNNWSNNNSNNSWSNSTNSSYERPTYSAPTRSTSSDGGGTRSHSTSSGSGSNGRTRGRD